MRCAGARAAELQVLRAKMCKWSHRGLTQHEALGVGRSLGWCNRQLSGCVFVEGRRVILIEWAIAMRLENERRTGRDETKRADIMTSVTGIPASRGLPRLAFFG